METPTDPAAPPIQDTTPANPAAQTSMHRDLGLLASALDHLPDQIYVMDRQFRFQYVNEAAVRELGYSREELLTMDVFGVNPVVTADFLQACGREAEATGRLQAPFETLQRAKDGRLIPTEISGGLLSREGDVLFIAVARNISERKRTEDELKLLTRAVNETNDAVFLMDPQWRFHYVNDTAVRSLGYSKEELLGMSVPDIDPTTSHAALEDLRMNAMASGMPVRMIETWHQAKDGHRYPVEIGAALVDHHGETWGLAFARDISERRRAEAAQREAYGELAIREQQFRTLAENSPDNIARYDRECRLIYANPRLFRELAALGGDPDSMIGSKPGGITRWPLADEYGRKIATVIATGKPEYWEAKWPTPSGVQCHDIRIVAERNADGEIIGALTIGRDITERVEMEQQLQASRAELRHLVARREADREDERRRIAREIHDDLGQQLTALRFAVSLLDFKPGDEQREPREPVARLLKMVDHSIRTVRDVSAWLRPAPIDMGLVPALEWLVGQFREHSDIDYQLSLPDADPDLSKDASINLFRIVQESLTNALRHAQARHVRVTLGSEDGDYVVEVRDDGIGFRPEQVQSGGSWGLVGIRERAFAVGGEATVESSPGQGTRVSVRVSGTS